MSKPSKAFARLELKFATKPFEQMTAGLSYKEIADEEKVDERLVACDGLVEPDGRFTRSSSFN